MKRSVWLVFLIALVMVGLQAGEAANGLPVPPVVVEPAPLADISKPDHVVGNGTPESVTEEALAKAIARGGVVVIHPGKPVTVTLTKPLELGLKARPCVIDGQGLVTLDGGGKTRILQKEWKTELTVQRLRFQHARADKEGGAIWNTNWDGRLTVIDCQFEDCKTISTGPDIGGGAIRVTGQRHLYVSGCSFIDCDGSNGGAICTIGCQMTLVNCTFLRCRAFGFGGGADRGPTGQGGIGGAVYIDGVDQNAEKKQLYVGNCLFKDNRAGDHAGAIFGYTRPQQKSLSIYYNSIFEGNTVDEPKEKGLGFAGAIYSQYCDLHVINCSFTGNKCPKLQGALFTAQMESERVANCEFYGNSPEYRSRSGENVSFRKRDVAPAVAALGRMPGVALPETDGKTSAAKEKAPAVARALVTKQEPKAERVADAAAVAEWKEKLRVRITAQLADAAAAKPRFNFLGQKATVTGQSSSGDLKVKLQSGGQTDVPWAQIGPAEGLELSASLLREGEPLDHALLAFYLLLNKRSAAAEGQLAKAGGALAASVSGCFRETVVAGPDAGTP